MFKDYNHPGSAYNVYSVHSSLTQAFLENHESVHISVLVWVGLSDGSVMGWVGLSDGCVKEWVGLSV